MFPFQIKIWLEQFSLVDRDTAILLLKSLRPIEENNLKKGIKKELINIAKMYPNRKIALFPVLEITQENGLTENHRGRKRAGSSQLISYFLECISRESPRVFSSRPTPRSMKSEKHAAIVYVDDFIGSGSRIIAFWQKGISKTIKSWLSYKYCDIYFVSGVCYETGISKIIHSIGNFQRDQFKSAFQASTFAPKNIDRFQELCKVYAHKLVQKDIPFGYGNIFSNIVFSYKCPNNTPAILWGDGNGWKALFPNTSVNEDVFSFLVSYKNKRTVERILDTGQRKLSSAILNNIDNLTDEDINFLCLLSLVARRVSQKNILIALNCTREYLSRLIKKAQKYKAIDDTNRITNFGKSLLAAYRKKVKKNNTCTHLDSTTPTSYIPTQYGGNMK